MAYNYYGNPYGPGGTRGRPTGKIARPPGWRPGMPLPPGWGAGGDVWSPDRVPMPPRTEPPPILGGGGNVMVRNPGINPFGFGFPFGGFGGFGGGFGNLPPVGAFGFGGASGGLGQYDPPFGTGGYGGFGMPAPPPGSVRQTRPGWYRDLPEGIGLAVEPPSQPGQRPIGGWRPTRGSY